MDERAPAGPDPDVGYSDGPDPRVPDPRVPNAHGPNAHGPNAHGPHSHGPPIPRGQADPRLRRRWPMVAGAGLIAAAFAAGPVVAVQQATVID